MSVITATISFLVNAATVGSNLLFTPNPDLVADTEGVADSGQILGEVTGGGVCSAMPSVGTEKDPHADPARA